MSRAYASLVDLLQARSAGHPADRAFVFLDDKGLPQQTLSFAELEQASRRLARRLAARAAPGERVLLAFPPGLEFVVAFFACLCAGLIAVPVLPPRRGRVRDSMLSIVQDCRPGICLGVERVLEGVREALPAREGHGAIACLGVDADLPWSAGGAAPWDDEPLRHAATRDTLAFLQYTSGSTSAPKGVMVSHGNLLDNLEMIRARFGNDRSATYVSWVPLYHDMGLILNVLQAFYAGALCVLMSPVHFMHRPLSWLRAIDRYDARVAGAPNFAFDLCVDRYRAEELEGLDLSRWRVAFNGAEPVRADTLERFAETFARHGFRRASLYPCYGMAEATLLISGGTPQQGPRLLAASQAALKDNRVEPAAAGADAKRCVGCGGTLAGEDIAIVDPATCRRAAADAIGEIWVRGPHVARGYWEKPEASTRTMAAVLEGEPGAGWLRTGDLGWQGADGELYIMGRLKDLVIIRGINHYPQDIERTMELSSPALRPHCNAAFSVQRDGTEVLVVVQEIERTARHSVDADEVMACIRNALVEQHELTPAEVVLIRTGTIPKTTSGKIRRALTRELWLNGALDRIDDEVAAERQEPVGQEPVGKAP